ncbi:transposable element Tcb2 transposase [Trichonephila clavipes]|nr:transposable element Tcb2 transposase [Trichonephila clavipes]
MNYYHLKNLHIGAQTLLYLVRQEFWPLGGRNTARRIVQNCVVCFKNKPKNLEQIMGNLPRERITPSSPFTHVGIDFTGPLYIKYKGQQKGIYHKCYVAIFICFITKAIHIEVVTELTTEATIATLKRFFSRRGKSTSICTDNATNFIGASRELQRLYNLIKNPLDILANYLTNEEIYPPPRSPNCGELWEAGVKSFKHHFKRTVGDACLTLEQFITITTQIESILNSHPLTPMSSDCNDFAVLTPGHFLIGRPLQRLPEPDMTDKLDNRLSRWQKLTKFVRFIWHENLPPCEWTMERILEVVKVSEGKVRVVKVKTPQEAPSKTKQIRGGQSCSKAVKPDDFDGQKKKASAHCLQFSDVWYSVSVLSEPVIYHNIFLDVYNQRHLINGSTVWVSLTHGEEFNLGIHNPTQYDENDTIVGTFYTSNPKPGMNRIAIDQTRLLIPQPMPGVSVTKLHTAVKNGAKDYLLLNKSLIESSGDECDTAGISYRGFALQPDRCEKKLGTRLHGGGLFARRTVRCVPLTPAHRKWRSLWCREHRNWRDNEWGRVLFTDESRFSLSSDSHHILIWRERGSRNHPSNIIERDRYGGRGALVWGGIMLGSRTDLHIFDAGSVNGTRYCNEILLPYVRLFRGAMGLQFLFMDDNAPCHRTVAAEQLLESEDIECMDWPARYPDLNPIEHVWDFLGRRLAARTLPPVTIRELRLVLQDEWAAMPQQLIDTLILSMGRRCETCLAVRGDHIPY